MSDERKSPSGVLGGGYLDPQWIFNDTEVSAGVDAKSGAPTLVIEDLRTEYGIDVPAVRLRLAPETAKRIGAALLLSADPDLAQRAIAALLAPAPARPERPRYAERGDAPVRPLDWATARAVPSVTPGQLATMSTAELEGVLTREAAVRSEDARRAPGFDWVNATPEERIKHAAAVNSGVMRRAREYAAAVNSGEGGPFTVTIPVHLDGRELPRVARRIVHRRRDGEPASVWRLPGEGPVQVSVGVSTKAEMQHYVDGQWVTTGTLACASDGAQTFTLAEAASASYGEGCWSIEVDGQWFESADEGVTWDLAPEAAGASVADFLDKRGPYATNTSRAPELPAELRGPAEPTATERALGWLDDIHGRRR